MAWIDLVAPKIIWIVTKYKFQLKKAVKINFDRFF